MAEPLRIALDWTPNANHVGFYVAAAKGWASLVILSPDRDGYTKTPAKAVLSGEADLAVTPTETAIAYACPKDGTDPVDGIDPTLVSVAALLQKDTSVLAALASPKKGRKAITRPCNLDGALYASYAARYEGAIVRAVVRADGGKGEVLEETPPKLDCFNRVLEGEADATWIFRQHEGVQATRLGVELRTWSVGDFGVPYGYSPVLLAQPSLLSSRKEELRALLTGVARGYVFAATHPEEAADILRTFSAHKTLEDTDFVRDSVAAVAPFLLDEHGNWGKQEEKVWDGFLSFLKGQGLLPAKPPQASRLFTNECLSEGGS